VTLPPACALASFCHNTALSLLLHPVIPLVSMPATINFCPQTKTTSKGTKTNMVAVLTNIPEVSVPSVTLAEPMYWDAETIF
jgi:hypothetical protein